MFVSLISILRLAAYRMVASALVGVSPWHALAYAQQQPESAVLSDSEGVQTPTPEDILLQMREAYQKKDAERLARLLPWVRGHVLEPWAAYWTLKVRLEEASAEEVEAFLTRWKGTYQEDRLRNDWLLLAGKRRDWANFAAEYPNFRMRDDPQVRCYAVALSDLQTLPSETIRQVRDDWVAQRKVDDGCQLAASLLFKAGKLTAHDVWLRARHAMIAGRVTLARATVEIVAPDVNTDMAQIQRSAIRYLLAPSTQANTPTARELVTLALIRVARSDPAQAATQLQQRWANKLTAEQCHWIWGAAGDLAARRLQDDALGYFAHVKRAQDLSPDMLTWKVRAALRQGQWKVVRDTIMSMPVKLEQQAVWTYWLGRARLQLARTAADRQAARAVLARVAGSRTYYAKLAAEELGRPLAASSELPPTPLTNEERAAVRQHAGLQRALLAIQIGLRSEGVREWNYWTILHQPGGMDERMLYAAADWACERMVWDRCINTSERIKSFSDIRQRFPMPFRDEVTQQASAVGLDLAYVYGLIRQESRFVMGARSVVGASGLMQIMPATARWTARKIGLVDFSPAQINDRATNLLLGTRYLKLTLDEFEGSLPMAAAGYNAGPGRPRSWRQGPTLEGAIWVENVPLAETRDYVQKVLANTVDYAAILTGQKQSLKARLGQIGPAPETDSTLADDLP